MCGCAKSTTCEIRKEFEESLTEDFFYKSSFKKNFSWVINFLSCFFFFSFFVNVFSGFVWETRTKWIELKKHEHSSSAVAANSVTGPYHNPRSHVQDRGRWHSYPDTIISCTLKSACFRVYLRVLTGSKKFMEKDWWNIFRFGKFWVSWDFLE